MIKFGIHNTERLLCKDLKSFWGKRTPIALDLYNQLQDLEPPQRNYIAEKVLARFATKDGIFKYTFSNRFDTFDEECFSYIKKNFNTNEALHVHDVGVSDGCSTVPFFLALNDIYANHLSYLASDYLPHAFVIRKKDHGYTRLILDPNDCLLQIIIPPFVFNMPRKEKLYLFPLNHIIRMTLTPALVNPLLRCYQEDQTALEIVKIPLISYDCQDLLTTNDNFHFEQYNILEPQSKTYQIIRVMNLLNESYFSSDDLKKAARNIFNALQEGGLFIAGSNMEAGTIVNGAIYKKENGKMVCLYSSGKGLAVHNIVMHIQEQSRVMK